MSLTTKFIPSWIKSFAVDFRLGWEGKEGQFRHRLKFNGSVQSDTPELHEEFVPGYPTTPRPNGKDRTESAQTEKGPNKSKQRQ